MFICDNPLHTTVGKGSVLYPFGTTIVKCITMCFFLSPKISCHFCCYSCCCIFQHFFGSLNIPRKISINNINALHRVNGKTNNEKEKKNKPVEKKTTTYLGMSRLLKFIDPIICLVYSLKRASCCCCFDIYFQLNAGGSSIMQIDYGN